jgi:predicted Fe-Mo cluster-binding NifX family protein
MKIAVAVIGEDEDSEISGRAGRAPYYLIFEAGKVVEKLSNPFSMGGGGAGFGVAKLLADKGVDAVVAGNFGPNMEQALSSRGVKTITMAGKAKEAVLKAGEGS